MCQEAREMYIRIRKTLQYRSEFSLPLPVCFISFIARSYLFVTSQSHRRWATSHLIKCEAYCIFDHVSHRRNSLFYLVLVLVRSHFSTYRVDRLGALPPA